MAAQRKYPEELRERAVKLVLEVRGVHPSRSVRPRHAVFPFGATGVVGGDSSELFPLRIWTQGSQRRGRL